MAIFLPVSPTEPSYTHQLLHLTPSRADSGVVGVKGQEQLCHVAGTTATCVGARGPGTCKADPFVGGSCRWLW